MGSFQKPWSWIQREHKKLLASSLKNRVRVHSTRYRRFTDGDGRSWITLDGEEVLNLPNIWSWIDRVNEEAVQIAKEMFGDFERYEEVREQAELALKEESVFWQGDLGRSLYRYLSMPISETLGSADPLLRALGQLDRRTGRRSLKRSYLQENHPLVRRFNEFRWMADWQLPGLVQQPIAADRRRGASS